MSRRICSGRTDHRGTVVYARSKGESTEAFSDDPQGLPPALKEHAAFPLPLFCAGVQLHQSAGDGKEQGEAVLCDDVGGRIGRAGNHDAEPARRH